MQEVTTPRKAKYIWRSLMWGEALLDNGLGWRIGNDNNILILTLKWLPSYSQFKISLPCNVQNTHANVNSLLVQNNDKKKLEFGNRILNATIAPYPMTDIAAWLPKSDCIYSVKRGYQFANFLLSLQTDNPQSLSKGDVEKLFKTI